MSRIHVESDLTRYELIDYLMSMTEYRNNTERDIEDIVGWVWRRIDTTQHLREAIVLGVNYFAETENNIETSNNLLKGNDPDKDDELEEVQIIELTDQIENLYLDYSEDATADMDAIIMVSKALAELIPDELGIFELETRSLVEFTKDSETFCFIF